MKRIPLRNKAGVIIAWATVDDADYDRLMKFRWHICGDGYAHRGEYISRGVKKSYSMHRELMRPPPGMEVDHRDRRKRNNTRKNLRVCTSQQNKCNSGLDPRNTSGTRGVSWHSTRRRWVVKITAHHRTHYIGSYLSKRAAVVARKKAVLKIHGEYAS